MDFEIYLTEQLKRHLTVKLQDVIKVCRHAKEHLQEDQSFVIAIDGRAASGKTTLAGYLQSVLDADVVHMDDFFVPFELRSEERFKKPGENIHHERFAEEVLPFLAKREPFSYRIFDCKKMDYTGRRELGSKPFRIVEGAYSCHPVFGTYADITVFSDVSPDVQSERIRNRNGEEMLKVFLEKWIPMEEEYFSHYRISDRADIRMSIQKKAVFCGMDVMLDCLALLEERGFVVVHIYTMEDDAYDRTAQIQAYAGAHQIPCSTERLTSQELARLEEDGVELMVVAGYVYKLPVSHTIRQVNIHPAYLPEGRGSWPMPVAILRGVDSGVTLHKLAERLDEGDILCRERLPVGADENLEELTERIKKTAVRLLSEFLQRPEALWSHAKPQEEGSYWKEPENAERTFALTDERERIARILRAFYGYGALCEINGVFIEIVRGTVDEKDEKLTEDELLLRLSDGSYLHGREWRLYTRPIVLKDREALERIRQNYQPQLSDYTFALLYCWQEEMQLSVYAEEDFYVVKGADYFFFPVGSWERTKQFLDGLLSLGLTPKLRFCDERMLAWLKETYPDRIRFTEAAEDCDYVVSNQLIGELPGRHFASRRKDLAHYCRSLPAPEAEYLTQENKRYLKQISERFSGADERPEQIAIEHLSELSLFGVLVREGEEYVGFALCSGQKEDTMQGHFMKCISDKRGSGFYLLKSCMDMFSGQFAYTNMEDDMGQEGLRRFKASFCPERIPSYTVTFGGENG